jgi:hypothetical protein
MKHTISIIVDEKPIKGKPDNYSAKVNVRLNDAPDRTLDCAAACLLALAARNCDDGFEKGMEDIMAAAIGYAKKIKNVD